MRSFYPKFDAFRELIYQVFQTDLWKNKDVVKKYKASVQKCNEGEIKELIKENEFLKLYRSYLYISDKYSKEVFSEAKSIYSYKELNIYKKNANYIWYAINCRTDFKIEMNDNCFKDIDDFTLKKMKKNINKIGTGITYNNITLDLIADISGEIEVTVINPLADLTYSYEQPIDPIIKKLFAILALVLIFGVIFPLIFLLISSTITLYVAITAVSVMIICLLLMVFLTGEYLGIIP